MKGLKMIFLVPLGLALLTHLSFAQQKMWVTSDKATLKADKTASAATLATLSNGSEVTVVSSADRWYRVRTASGKEGWIYGGRLSSAPPATGGQSDNLFADMGGSKISAGEADTARSIRGLSRETEQYAKRRRTPEAYQKALDQVLALSVGEKQVEKFLERGKIGEYAQ